MRSYKKLIVIIKNNYFLIPFLLFFIFLLIFHLFLPTNLGDDLAHTKVLSKYGNILNFLSHRYDAWSSRSIIEFFLPYIASLPGKVWKFLDSLIFLIISISIPKIFINKKTSSKEKLIYNTLSCLLIGAFIFTTYDALKSAGWIATTLNYLWPIGFGLLHFALHKEYLTKKHGKIKKIAIYSLMIFSLIFAINQELMLIVILGVYIFIFIYYFYKKIEIPISIYIMSLIIILGFLYFVLCPGNHYRYLEELKWWFPDYGTLTIFNKLDISTTTMFYKILIKINLVVLLFFAAIGTYTSLLVKKKTALISFIPFILIIFIYTIQLLNITPIIFFLKSGFSIYGIFTSNVNFIIIFTILYLLVILSTVYSLTQIYKHKSKIMFYQLSCLLLLAIASQIPIGFSPTVWATADRWWIISTILISIATFILIVPLLEKYLKIKN